MESQTEPRRPTEQPADGWWEPVRLDPGQTGRWRIGALGLDVHRRQREWLVFETELEELDEPDWSFDRLHEGPEEGEAATRYVFRQTVPLVRLRPTLADRAIVTSPRIPLHVPPGEEATLYVSSSLWVRIESGEPPVTLHEAAVRRSSDTWFGPNTREGELCYATRTKAAVDLDNVQRTTRRAVTSLRIHNRALAPLHVQRLKLPVPFLSVFHSRETSLLWTEAVSVVLHEDSEEADVRIHGSPPSSAGETELLAPARQETERGLLVRAFGSLFR